MSTHRPASVVSLRPTPRILLAGLVGGAATASGVALTATSGWLIVRASEMPVILTLLVAVVAVRAFGIARPVLRYAERLLSHDEALADLARRRSRMYAALVPLTPARLGRRSRSSLLAGVVDDITDVVDAHVRVTVPGVSRITPCSVSSSGDVGPGARIDHGAATPATSGAVGTPTHSVPTPGIGSRPAGPGVPAAGNSANGARGPGESAWRAGNERFDHPFAAWHLSRRG